MGIIAYGTKIFAKIQFASDRTYLQTLHINRMKPAPYISLDAQDCWAMGCQTQRGSKKNIAHSLRKFSISLTIHLAVFQAAERMFCKYQASEPSRKCPIVYKCFPRKTTMWWQSWQTHPILPSQFLAILLLVTNHAPANLNGETIHSNVFEDFLTFTKTF